MSSTISLPSSRKNFPCSPRERSRSRCVVRARRRPWPPPAAPTPSQGTSPAAGGGHIDETAWLVPTLLAVPAGERFLSLTDSNLVEPYPALIRVSVPVQRGRYELGFSLGQDKDQGLPGPVSADADVSGAATRHQTFSTAAAGDNWQPFTMDFDVAADGSVRITFSATSKQGPVRYVGLDNVSLRRFMTLSRCLTGQ